jgi:hypothetical protein
MKSFPKIFTIVSWLVGVFSLFAPVIPGSVTGWDEVADWQIGLLVEIMVLYRLLTFFQKISSMRMHSEEAKGDGFEWWLQEHCVMGVFDLALMAGCLLSLASIALIFSSSFRAFCSHVWFRVTATLVLIASAYQAAWIVRVSAKTYVSGAWHFDVGTFPWFASFILAAAVYWFVPKSTANVSQLP